MKGRRKVWLLFLTVLLVTFGIGWFISAWLDTSHPPYSSRSPAEEGTKGIYRLLEARGIPVDRWETGWSRLPDTKGNVLWIVEPTEILLTEGTFGELQKWIRKGNTVVLWSRPGDTLSDRLGFGAHETHKGEQEILMPPSADGWGKEIRTLHFVHDGRLESSSDLDDVWKDREEIPRVGMRQMGEGTVYYIPESELITNQYIDQGDNLALVLYFSSLRTGEGKVWFDETAHRMGAMTDGMEESSPSLVNLLTPMMWWFILQLLLLFILWLYRKGKRFASPRWETVREVRTGDEYIRAMASLYEWAGLGRESLSLQLNSLIRESKTRLGLRPQASEEILCDQVEKLVNADVSQRLRTLIIEVKHLPESPKGRTLIRLSREMQKLREELEGWKRMGSIYNRSESSPKGF